MNPYIQSLYTLSGKSERIILGLMSGTSLDGLDLALCKVSGNGANTQCEVLAFSTVDYDQSTKNTILEVFAKKTVDLQFLTLLNPWIGELHAKIINEQLEQWGIDSKEIDLIASHGQTIYHSPKHFHEYSEFNNATLQLGDGDHIAVNTGIITISDFRQKHIAAGYEGAPLAQYGDYCVFGSADSNTLLLNIGGIANFTYIKTGASLDDLVCSDIGPGNTIMDQFVKTHFNEDYDRDGLIAASGQVNKQLLNSLTSSDFINQPMPKTTGPELFNLEFLENCVKSANVTDISKPDIMATLNMFTAQTIADHIKALKTKGKIDVLVSGGGAHNRVLMKNLERLLSKNVRVEKLNFNGINADSKEAVLFAVLANECVCADNDSANQDNLTLGKISLPL
ncbi:anhydro-N-acetylmuramic acid kinase [Pseudoalteromonas luteoviolacea]|uniref:anhydro-N-acetylmuramic acid kinase n=1 Tax=Pseudoalteromonas luteoviolacea TaxID=43657 RepID=UPI001B397D4F|nr:anhydro-N-acetylmuramic acid kinase [Pseudoalteromonas luteoviolacea]MBQ4810509.1 anhydro-N-acetylmuramic acid kinase [Pseudoalteromonas luteoviolacea]